MRLFRRASTALLIATGVCTVSAMGQTVLDPGFETSSVAPGEWSNAAGGPWQFNNNAGVVRPFAAPTATSPQMTWAATIAPYEGLQYASAYAGSDFFDTMVDFPAPGDYIFSVYAASPSDEADVNNAVFPLSTGEFRFALSGFVTGPTFSPSLDAGWNPYSTMIHVNSAGTRLAGFHTTKTASYFIYFDVFSVSRVPEPTCGGLAFVALMAGLQSRLAAPRRRHDRRGASAAGAFACDSTKPSIQCIV